MTIKHHIIDTLPKHPISRIGKCLVEMGKISIEDTEKILKKQNETGQRFGDAAISLGLVSDEDIKVALSQQFEYSFITPANSTYHKDLRAAYDPFSNQVESYRGLRSQLLFRWFNEGFKAVSFISSNRGEGASYLVSNLAVTFAQLGKKTLLIDGNLRHPRVHEIFNLKNKFGLSDILVDRVSVIDALQHLQDIPNLSVLSSGTVPPNPQELLGRLTFNQIIKNASTVFDVILIDTPAISDCSDSQIWSSLTKGVVMVSRLHHTSIEDLKVLKRSVDLTDASMIGAVVNEF
ncbi:polysaccharide biosynthesis tyrosine autokinase [Methylophilus sp.]|uniref:polysaccharide biosynthesis tyrosine autokinase n=1 Tax=Methylophilus sp. TaxID=29541 RepID=UPI004037B98F